MPLHLFDDIERTDVDPARGGEPTFPYLNRSARPTMARVREVMEHWFSRYPAARAEQLRGALIKPKDHRQELGAFWELYLHETFLRAGWAVDVHADTPDFTVVGDDGRFYVEATSTAASDNNVLGQHRVARLFEALARTRTGRWRICVGAEPGPSSASARLVRREIETWLAKLDFAEAFKKRDSVHRWPRWGYRRDGWLIEVQAFALGEELEGDESAIYMSGPAEMVRVTNEENIKETIFRKVRKFASSYDAPLILAVSLNLDYGNEYQFTSALFGTSSLEDALKADRVDDRVGIWSKDRGRAARLAAVLGATRLTPFSIARMRPSLWVNPLRSRSPMRLPEHVPWVQRWFEDEGVACASDASDPAAFFELPNDWPGRD